MHGTVATLLCIQCTCTFVTVHAYISLIVPKEVRYGKDKLTFFCLPSSNVNSASLSDIILWKNSSAGWKVVVKVFSDVSTGELIHRASWPDYDFRKRAVVKQAIIFPSTNSGLRFTIGARSVKFTDGGTYRCSIDGNFPTGEKLNSFSSSIDVEITNTRQVEILNTASHYGDHILTGGGASTVTPTGEQTGFLLVYVTPIVMAIALITAVVIIANRRRKRLKGLHLNSEQPNSDAMEPNVEDILPYSSESIYEYIEGRYEIVDECFYVNENQVTTDLDKSEQNEESCSICFNENKDIPGLKSQEREEDYRDFLCENESQGVRVYDNKAYSVCLNENQNTPDFESEEIDHACSVCLYENQDTIDLKYQG